MAKHVFEVKALVLAAPSAVYRALTCDSNFEALFSAVQGLSPEATGVFGGRVSTLFLREDVHLRVVDAQALERFVVQLDDKYNVITYGFSIAPEAAGTTVVCRVECCTCSAEGSAWPSEKLARMMQRQDGAIAERLKGYVERAGADGVGTVSVC